MIRILFAIAVVSIPSSALAERPAVEVRLGSVARDQVVAIGRDVVIAGSTSTDVAAVNGDAHVSGRVGGDLVVLGGEAFLSESAEIGGDLFVLGGAIELADGAVVTGRSVSYPSVGAAWLTLLEGPAVGISAFSPVVLAAKFALMMAWMLLVLLLFSTCGRPMLSTAAGVHEAVFRNFFVGLSCVLACVTTSVLLTALNVSVLAAPLLVLLVLGALILKLWGMVGVFCALGNWVGERLSRRLTPLNAAVVGLLVLGVLKFVPFIGVISWTVATLIGVGATLTTKFGRREAWFGSDLRSPAGSAMRP